MPANQPIDYARADSADVVRKKFRRPVVMSLIATVVVMGIGLFWATTKNQRKFLIGDGTFSTPFSFFWDDGWIYVSGPIRTSPSANAPLRGYGSNTTGITIYKMNIFGAAKWTVGIRDRTLFTLAAIPWIITLIRLIRSWRSMRILGTEPRMN